jgi:hypothetical protein
MHPLLIIFLTIVALIGSTIFYLVYVARKNAERIEYNAQDYDVPQDNVNVELP